MFKSSDQDKIKTVFKMQFHVTQVSIQKLHENGDQRNLEEIGGVSFKLQGRSLMAHFSNGNADESIKKDPIEDAPFSKTTHNVELHGKHTGSNGSDITISSSNSSSGLDSPPEPGLMNGDLKIEWSAGLYNGMSTDDSNSSQDTFPRGNSQHGSDNRIEKLKNELIAVSREVNVSDLKLQTLRKQIVKESRRGQDLTREVVTLKEEKDAFILECDKLKAFQKQYKHVEVGFYKLFLGI